jgi:hypothetical protein
MATAAAGGYSTTTGWPMSDDLHITLKLPQGSRWKAEAETVGGTRLKRLPDPQGVPEGGSRVHLSAEAWRALKRLRNNGERVSDALERLLLTAEGNLPSFLQNKPDV